MGLHRGPDGSSTAGLLARTSQANMANHELPFLLPSLASAVGVAELLPLGPACTSSHPFFRRTRNTKAVWCFCKHPPPPPLKWL